MAVTSLLSNVWLFVLIKKSFRNTYLVLGRGSKFEICNCTKRHLEIKSKILNQLKQHGRLSMSA